MLPRYRSLLFAPLASLAACFGGADATEARIRLHRHTPIKAVAQLYPGSLVALCGGDESRPALVCGPCGNHGEIPALEREYIGPIAAPKQLVKWRVPYFELIGPHPGRSATCTEAAKARQRAGYAVAEVESAICADAYCRDEPISPIGIRLRKLAPLTESPPA